MVNHVNENEYGHILTIEDPIEFLHESKKCLINQRELGPHTLSFPNALRSALREDPDYILVGEMRDLETIRLALTAAETGHLVFATLHTSSAAKTIDRIIDVFPAAEKDMVRAMLSESLVSVISQTLLKTKDGQGRVAAHEIMIGTPAIRNLIRENKVAQMYSAIQTSQTVGMQTLDQCLVELVRRNQVNVAEARNRAVNKDLFLAADGRSRPAATAAAGASEGVRMERERATKFIHELLELLVKQKGSDLFITAGFPPAIKVDGKIQPVSKTALTPQHTIELVRSVMNDKQAAEFESTKECNFAIAPPGIGRFRVNAFVQQGRIGMVLRTITTDIPKFEELGLPPVLKDVIMSKRGIMMFVGATGCGKSTSMASLLGYRNENSYGHIITIEDPIEFVHEHRNCIVTQREVGVDTDDWQIALKNSLRQAPDVILIGEVRERETMDYAISFAETGHLLPRDAAREQHEPGARPDHQLLPRGAPRAAADGPVAQRPRVRRAAADPAPRRPRPRAGGRGDAELAAHLRPDLQGRRLRHQGDHEEVARARHADVRPVAVRPLRGGPHQLRGRAAQRRLAERPAARDQAARQGSEGPQRLLRHRQSRHRARGRSRRRVGRVTRAPARGAAPARVSAAGVVLR